MIFVKIFLSMCLKLSKPFFFLFLIFNLTHCASFIITPSPELIWPLKKHILSQKFAPLLNPSHQGIDFKANRGTPILSSHSGRVVYAGQRLTGYGNTVIVEFSKYWSTLYAHLHHIKVKEGQIISRGDILGTVGQTGITTGVHLHFELMYKKQPVNPLIYFK